MRPTSRSKGAGSTFIGRSTVAARPSISGSASSVMPRPPSAPSASRLTSKKLWLALIPLAPLYCGSDFSIVEIPEEISPDAVYAQHDHL
jgi:hypothetical protein